MIKKAEKRDQIRDVTRVKKKPETIEYIDFNDGNKRYEYSFAHHTKHLTTRVLVDENWSCLNDKKRSITCDAEEQDELGRMIATFMKNFNHLLLSELSGIKSDEGTERGSPEKLIEEMKKA